MTAIKILLLHSARVPLVTALAGRVRQVVHTSLANASKQFGATLTMRKEDIVTGHDGLQAGPGIRSKMILLDVEAFSEYPNGKT
jgi:hypothetical protein